MSESLKHLKFFGISAETINVGKKKRHTLWSRLVRNWSGGRCNPFSCHIFLLICFGGEIEGAALRVKGRENLLSPAASVVFYGVLAE